jgi:hypothetical protein
VSAAPAAKVRLRLSKWRRVMEADRIRQFVSLVKLA